MVSDPWAILAGIALLVIFLIVGSRLLPDQTHLDPWRYHAPPDRPGGQEDDDARFHWDQSEPRTPSKRGR